MIRRLLTNKQQSKNSEREAARELGGKTQPGSGSIQGLKGDVKSAEYLLEDKLTAKKSYSLKLDILKKIEREAFHVRRKPLLRVTMQGETYYVLPKRVFLQMIPE